MGPETIDAGRRVRTGQPRTERTGTARLSRRYRGPQLDDLSIFRAGRRQTRRLPVPHCAVHATRGHCVSSATTKRNRLSLSTERWRRLPSRRIGGGRRRLLGRVRSVAALDRCTRSGRSMSGVGHVASDRPVVPRESRRTRAAPRDAETIGGCHCRLITLRSLLAPEL